MDREFVNAYYIFIVGLVALVCFIFGLWVDILERRAKRKFGKWAEGTGNMEMERKISSGPLEEIDFFDDDGNFIGKWVEDPGRRSIAVKCRCGWVSRVFISDLPNCSSYEEFRERAYDRAEDLLEEHRKNDHVH